MSIRAETLETLKNSPLPNIDRGYVICSIEEKPENPDLEENLHQLVEQSALPRVRHKILARQQAEPVDLRLLLSQRGSGFNESEIEIIAKNLGILQLNDRCSVGCAWCGFRAQKMLANGSMGKKFSYDSVKSFLENYGVKTPQRLLYYGGSDPFDWIDDNHSVSNILLTSLSKMKRMVSITTALPEGSELTVLRYLELLHQVWKVTEHRKSDPVPFRFSRTVHNSQRISQVLTILQAKGTDQEFINGIKEGIEDRSNETVWKLGYFINHPLRNEVEDAQSFGCFDGVWLTPSKGPVAISMQCATLQNSTGMMERTLAPGRMEIPSYLHVAPFRRPATDERGNIFPFLPPVKYQIFEDGQYMGERVEEGVGRDALAFDFAAGNLGAITHLAIEHPEASIYLKNHPHISRRILHQLRYKFWPQFIQRRDRCRAIYDDSTDPQAKKVAEHYINKIEAWFEGLDSLTTELGLTPGLRQGVHL